MEMFSEYQERDTFADDEKFHLVVYFFSSHHFL